MRGRKNGREARGKRRGGNRKEAGGKKERKGWQGNYLLRIHTLSLLIQHMVLQFHIKGFLNSKSAFTSLELFVASFITLLLSSMFSITIPMLSGSLFLLQSSLVLCQFYGSFQRINLNIQFFSLLFVLYFIDSSLLTP